ncbi:uncharacterized protein LOC124616311 [Schistocerca americana]|uniref:uncharacterized protein LOC124616311 n=1 Tax=Schistocerca americana TaxID=7009 RepID=UPI001F4F501A|nr:uncharacterized protein LOC124616311 [Schistocerca americana]
MERTRGRERKGGSVANWAWLEDHPAAAQSRCNAVTYKRAATAAVAAAAAAAAAATCPQGSAMGTHFLGIVSPADMAQLLPLGERPFCSLVASAGSNRHSAKSSVLRFSTLAVTEKSFVHLTCLSGITSRQLQAWCYWGAQEASEPVAPRWPPGFCRSFFVHRFGPRRVPAAPSDFAAAPRAAAAAVAATTPTARPVDASRAASSGSAPGGRSGACGPSSVATAFGADGRRPPSQAVAVQPVLQPLSLGTPKESDTAAPCPAPTQQPSTQRQETLPLFVGPDAPSRPVPEAAPVVTGPDAAAMPHTGAVLRPVHKDTELPLLQ